MPKADLYKISITDGKVLLRIPQQLIGAETANMDEIQAELHLMGVDMFRNSYRKFMTEPAVSLIF